MGPGRRVLCVVTLIAGCSFDPSGASVDPDADPNAPDADPRAADADMRCLPGGDPDDYALSKTITIDRSFIDNSACSATIASYPLLYRVTDPDLRDGVTDPEGDDIIFVANDDVTCASMGPAPCVLDHEIETWEPASGQLVAWLRVPSINTAIAASDTAIQIRYGNPLVSASTQNPAAVWDSSYGGVWHLQQDPGPGGADDIEDSTANGNHGTAQSSMNADDLVPGRIGGSLVFDGSDDDVAMGAASSLDMADGDFALSLWFQTTSNVLNIDTLGGKGVTGGGGKRYRLSINDSDCGVGSVKGDVDDDSIDELICSQDAGYIDGAWHHAVLVRDGNNLRLYTDGTEDPSSPIDISGYGNVDSPGVFSIGSLDDGGTRRNFFDGGLDEIRISNTSRDACWIDTNFENQSAPGDVGNPGFYSVGSEVPCQ